MKKKGMVIEIKNRNAIIMTEAGEFTRVRFENSIPICGEDYEGYEVKDKSVFRKFFITAAAAMFIFILAVVDYYNPVKAVELDMNSKIMLGLNRWNCVMTTSAQDKKGEKVLRNANVKNISLDKAIEKLIVEAKKEKVIESFSEVKVNSAKGNVDLSLIKSNIQKESIIDGKKVRNSTNEVKNEDKSLKQNDNKVTNLEHNGMLPSSNSKNENMPNNNGNSNSEIKIDSEKDKTNNVNQSNKNKNKTEDIKDNNEDTKNNNFYKKSNNDNVDKGTGDDYKLQGGRKK